MRIRAICICIYTIFVFLRDARLALSAIGNKSREESQQATLTLDGWTVGLNIAKGTTDPGVDYFDQ